MSIKNTTSLLPILIKIKQKRQANKLHHELTQVSPEKI